MPHPRSCLTMRGTWILLLIDGNLDKLCGCLPPSRSFIDKRVVPVVMSFLVSPNSTTPSPPSSRRQHSPAPSAIFVDHTAPLPYHAITCLARTSYVVVYSGIAGCFPPVIVFFSTRPISAATVPFQETTASLFFDRQANGSYMSH